MSNDINEALLEGISANDWAPGAWTNTPAASDEEYQPDIEPPHINDYAGFKKHKHYRQYFRPHRYVAFPAWVYHKTLEPKLIDKRNKDGTTDQEACKKEVMALGPEWGPVPTKPRLDMTGKSSPVKSETQRLAEVVAQGIAQRGSAPIDANAIAAIVSAVLAATQGQPASTPAVQADAAKAEPSEDVERSALIELAAKDGVKIDKRWSNARIKTELGI